MGFTSWPYAATVEAVQGTYDFIGANADIITEQVDEGVPWAEMVRDEPLPAWFVEKMEGRRQNRPPGMKLVLYLTPTNLAHDALADCLGEGNAKVPLPAELVGKPWNDPAVVSAYTRYCCQMIEFFDPDYAISAVESNELLNNAPETWDAYADFSRQVRSELRRGFPGVLLSESVTLHKLLESGNPDLEGYQSKVRDFCADHDFLAVSSYPLFMNMHAEDEFGFALDFLPTFSDKRIAFAETGHQAETLRLASMNFEFPADPAEQAEYARTLLSRAQAERYLFVTWWTSRDFDALWETFPESIKELGSIWRDTGLLDADGTPRPAFSVWKEWLDRPLAAEVGE
jgi:hypothetical protein